MKRLRPAMLAALAVASCAGALVACGSAPPVTVTLHRLPLGGTAPGATAAPALQLTLPAYLDRDALLVPAGAAGGSALVPLGEHRWAEPLAVGVARVLRHELAARGLARPLRVELLAFEATADRRHVQLVARWNAGDGNAAGGASLLAPVTGAGADALVAAHRAALAELAARISAAATRPPG